MKYLIKNGLVVNENIIEEKDILISNNIIEKFERDIQIKEDYKLFPCDGVFFIKTHYNNNTFYGMMNVGFRPTLEGEERSFEVHLFNFNQNLYGEILQVDLLELIRKEKKFASLEDLKAQLQEDKAKCRKLIPAK